MQEHEYLLIGTELIGDKEPLLLGDYLKLCGRFIPLQSLAPRVQELVGEAMDNLLNDPIATERALRVIARYTGHPDALRALIKFYRVRQDKRRMLDASARLWDITEDTDSDLPLVWIAVREGFEVTWRYETEDLPIDFVAAIWNDAGGNDIEVGLKLVQTLDNFGREEDAVAVASRLFAQHPDQEIVGEAVLRHLVSSGQHEDAARFAELHADEFAYDHDYLALWGNAVAEVGDRGAAAEFLEDHRVDLEALREQSPSTLFRVLRAAGRETEGATLINGALEQAVATRDYETLVTLAEEFARRGPTGQRHFETMVRRRLPDVADEFLVDVRRSVSGWRTGPRVVTR